MPPKKPTTPAVQPEIVRGYKVTDPNGQCRGMQYEIGKDYTLPSVPVLCGKGLHFCLIANNCFEYYGFDPKNRVFEVEAFGQTVTEGNKSATNGLRLLRELSWHEVLTAINSGTGNTGRANSGDLNSGNRNSGDLNSGNRNSGNRNSGNRNSGNRNSGNRNSGDLNSGNLNSGNRNSGDLNSGNRNSGNLNSGDLNSGDWNSGDLNSGNLNSGDLNSGDWNSGDLNSGVFCTESPKTIHLFNQPSDWSYQQWLDSEACYLKNRVKLTEWRSWSEMSDAEKEQRPRAETSEGYLLTHDYKQAHATWWTALNARERACITSLPNFSAEVFRAITGIDITA